MTPILNQILAVEEAAQAGPSPALADAGMLLRAVAAGVLYRRKGRVYAVVPLPAGADLGPVRLLDVDEVSV